MGLEAALERPGSALGTLVVVKDEAEVVGRTLPSDRLPERIRDQLLGHAPRHRPAHDLPMERDARGCEAGPSFARSDAGDPSLLRRPQGAERLQRPEDDASRDREGVEQGAQRRPEADRRDRQLQQARLVEVQGGPRVVRPHSEPSAQGQGGPGLPVLLGAQGARRLQRPGHHTALLRMIFNWTLTIS